MIVPKKKALAIKGGLAVGAISLAAGAALVFNIREVLSTKGLRGSVSHVIVNQPLPEAESLVLFFVGDTGSGDQKQQAVAYRMEQECVLRRPKAIVLLGDNFYTEGVSGTDDPQWQSKFESMYATPCLAALSFYAVLGNHDVRANPGAQIEYTGQGSGRWHMPARVYGLSFGDRVKIAMIDSNLPDYCNLPGCSLGSLIDDLKNVKTRWTLLAGHHPLLSGGKYPKPAWLRRQLLKASYCGLGADVYLSGHDHNLQSLIMKDPGYPSCEVHQIVSGGGGANLYPVAYRPGVTQFAASAHGFVSGQFTNQTATFEFLDVEHPSPIYSMSRRSPISAPSLIPTP